MHSFIQKKVTNFKKTKCHRKNFHSKFLGTDNYTVTKIIYENILVVYNAKKEHKCTLTENQLRKSKLHLLNKIKRIICEKYIITMRNIDNRILLHELI